jgi:hypothetical protein
MLGGEPAVLQAPMLDGLAFDPFTLFGDGLDPAEVGIGGCHIVQALMVAPMVVVFDERFDLGLKVSGQKLILQRDAILEGLVPMLDLALGLGMARSAAHMAHAPGLDIFGQFARDVARAIVRQQPWLVPDVGLVAATAASPFPAEDGETEKIIDARPAGTQHALVAATAALRARPAARPGGRFPLPGWTTLIPSRRVVLGRSLSRGVR